MKTIKFLILLGNILSLKSKLIYFSVNCYSLKLGNRMLYYIPMFFRQSKLFKQTFLTL